MTPLLCPACNADLTSAPIPQEHLEHYGDETHYSRVIGVYSIVLDRTVEWQCPDCGYRWERW
jgi:hypothetical protein